MLIIHDYLQLTDRLAFSYQKYVADIKMQGARELFRSISRVELNGQVMYVSDYFLSRYSRSRYIYLVLDHNLKHLCTYPRVSNQVPKYLPGT